MAEFSFYKSDTPLYHWNINDATGTAFNLTNWTGTFQARVGAWNGPILFQATNCTVGYTATPLGTVEIRLAQSHTANVGSMATTFTGQYGTSVLYQLVVGTYSGGSTVIREHVADTGTLHILWR